MPIKPVASPTPHQSPVVAADACLGWLQDQLAQGDSALVPSPNGEDWFAHARGAREILSALGADQATMVAAVLFGAVPPLKLDAIENAYGAEVRALVEGVGRLLRLRSIGALAASSAAASAQVETLRRMLLAMSSDIRVVLIRLASRVQTLRFHAAVKREPEPGLAKDSLEVLAPLANRLGLWQLKWELEDLAFRFLDPDQYRSIARRLDERRTEREASVAAAIARLRQELAQAGIAGQVSGRAKHIYSIASKMRAKRLDFDQVQDLRAFRVIVGDVRACYTVLGIVHTLWRPLADDFDDYIARPKPNGYRSLHTVVLGDDERPFEIQIRTQEMHDHAEYGVAAHWRYKEKSTGLVGSASASPDAQDLQRIAWVRQLLAWQRDVGAQLGSGEAAALAVDPHLYVLTPQARVIELPQGSTPLDFAYQLHTELGHRCRGARVDGILVPLDTPLRNGQTVEVLTSRNAQDGPSRDWLNPERRYLASQRARAKVRQWFNALEIERDIASGRALVERTLAREGRTVVPFETLAQRLGLADPRALFLAMAREEIGPRALEQAIRAPHEEPVEDAAVADAQTLARIARGRPPSALHTAGAATGSVASSGVLVVGVDVLSQLARCCRPVPPDPIQGFVTRGRGISIHRSNCRSLAELTRRSPERVLEAAWDGRQPASQARFPLDIQVRANDRAGLLRDVSDVLARDRINVTAVQTLTRGEIATMRFTVEVAGREQAQAAMAALRGIRGVLEVGRRG